MPFDLMQVILVLTVVVLTALLTVLGIEVFYILKDVRKLIDRVNGVVGDAEVVVGHIKKPTEYIASISQSADILSKLFEVVKHHSGNREEQKPFVEEHAREIKESNGHNLQSLSSKEMDQPIQSKPLSIGRRFFKMPRRPLS